MSPVTYFMTLVTLCLCDPHQSNPLDSTKYEEKDCVEKPPPATDLKEDFISNSATWYMPMASAWWYHTWVERLTNQSATPGQLQKLCLRLLFLVSAAATAEKAAVGKAAPYLIAAGGLNRVLTYDCASTSLTAQVCEGIPGTPGYTPKELETEEVIVKTDNENYILLVQCYKKTLKSWYVLSPFDALPTNDMKKDVVQTIVGLGFDRALAAGISYAACPKPKPVEQSSTSPAESREGPPASPRSPPAPATPPPPPRKTFG